MLWINIINIDHLFDGDFHTTYEVPTSWRAFFNVVSPGSLIHGVLDFAATTPAALVTQPITLGSP